MNTPNFTDPQFVDAAGVGGLNTAFGSVSGTLSVIGSDIWAVPGLIAPEAMTLSFSGMVATVGLPAPWGLVTSGGTVVQAHGTQTGQNTTTYSVNFAGSVPATGTANVWLAATPTQIQQNPFPIPGPPPGHPSYNPNYLPTVGYATLVDSVSLSVSGAAPNNTAAFNLFRTTLTAGQTSIATVTTGGQVRAGDRKSWPLATTNGGNLTIALAQNVLLPSSGGITSTLPPTSGATGLMYTFVNPMTGIWTIAAAGTDRIAGMNLAALSSQNIPASGSMTVMCDSSFGQWEVVAFSPSLMLNTVNAWRANQVYVNNIFVQGQDTAGGIHNMIGYGGDNRVAIGGGASGTVIVNNAGSVINMFMDDSGNVNFNGIVAAANALRANNGAFGFGDVNRATLLLDFPSVNSIGGWCRLPNGLIFQWGRAAVPLDNTQHTVNFPIAFPTGCYLITTSAGAVTPVSGGMIGADPVNQAQFIVIIVTPSNIPTTLGTWFFAVGS